MKYVYIFFLVCSLVKFVIFMFKMLNLLWHNFDFNQFLVATWFWMLFVWEPFHKSHFRTHGSKFAMLVKICYACFLMTPRCWKLISFLMLNLMFDLDNLRILNDFMKWFYFHFETYKKNLVEQRERETGRSYRYPINLMIEILKYFTKRKTKHFKPVDHSEAIFILNHVLA